MTLWLKSLCSQSWLSWWHYCQCPCPSCPLLREVPEARAALGAISGVSASYLLQLGVPRQLLHHQSKALRELQLARPGRLPEQHLPVGGHTQHAEAVAGAGLSKPDHLGQHGVGPRLRKGCLLPGLPPTSHGAGPNVIARAPPLLFQKKAIPRLRPGSQPAGAGLEGSQVPPCPSRKPGQLEAGNGLGVAPAGGGGDSCPESSKNAEGSCPTANPW